MNNVDAPMAQVIHSATQAISETETSAENRSPLAPTNRNRPPTTTAARRHQRLRRGQKKKTGDSSSITRKTRAHLGTENQRTGELVAPALAMVLSIVMFSPVSNRPAATAQAMTIQAAQRAPGRS